MEFIDNLSVNEQGNLTMAGVDTVTLAEKYGTPLYVMDENRIRNYCRIYVEAMKKYFGENALPLYASKALSFKKIYEIVGQEHMGVDVVSSGELYTAMKAGFPVQDIYFHGNNKTDSDIEFGIKNGVGCFVADNFEEIDAIDRIAKSYSKKQKVMLRLSPGIDPHTFEAVATGKVDSKFGFAIETGLAESAVKYALDKKNIDLAGYHCHIGSQIFEIEPFCDGADIMIEFMAEIRDKYGYEARELNLGGGFGVRYLKDDMEIDYDKNIKLVSEHITAKCREFSLNMPRVLMEPGRAIVADCGITLYTVGAVKEISGFKNYVSVDGGMADNPRYALYGAPYTAVIANKADRVADYNCTIAGRCCESGDLIQENVLIQKPARGDIMAVLVTGAYNYSMASNYNRLPKPPIVMLYKGKDYVAVKGETLDDIIRNDK